MQRIEADLRDSKAHAFSEDSREDMDRIVVGW